VLPALPLARNRTVFRLRSNDRAGLTIPETDPARLAAHRQSVGRR